MPPGKILPVRAKKFALNPQKPELLRAYNLGM